MVGKAAGWSWHPQERRPAARCRLPVCLPCHAARCRCRCLPADAALPGRCAGAAFPHTKPPATPSRPWPWPRPAGWELQSGKFAVLAGMLELLRTCTGDRIVVVSNYTQTLDLVAQARDRKSVV